METKKTIGVLALQGAYALHRPHIEALDAKYKEVRHQTDFEGADALIIPGGESGVLLRFIKDFDLVRTLRDIAKTKPLWGICAGAILMAEEVENPSQDSLKILDIKVERNGYGTQKESFHSVLSDYEVCFIRAPKIRKWGGLVQVDHELKGEVVGVSSETKEGISHFATTFHPETSETLPSPWHRRLYQNIK